MINKENTANTINLIHSDQYVNWIFDSTHPTQGRRFINAKNLLSQLFVDSGKKLNYIEPRMATRSELLRIHSPKYITEVLDQYMCDQWSGKREDLANLAAMFTGGTLVGLELLLSGKTKTVIHFPGAKHHAQFDRSSGFCVFADFALAADIATKEHRKKVAILDIDAHHGDGTENLTSMNPAVMTFSIHEFGIFPGTGYKSYPEQYVYNYPLGSNEKSHNPSKNDLALLTGVNEFCELAKTFKPDLLFVACGADGHKEDPLTSLEYSVQGYVDAAKKVREQFPNIPILLGGAGGYLPDTRTPEVWANVAITLAI